MVTLAIVLASPMFLQTRASFAKAMDALVDLLPVAPQITLQLSVRSKTLYAIEARPESKTLDTPWVVHSVPGGKATISWLDGASRRASLPSANRRSLKIALRWLYDHSELALPIALAMPPDAGTQAFMVWRLPLKPDDGLTITVLKDGTCKVSYHYSR
jgi:hypothetical protein